MIELRTFKVNGKDGEGTDIWFGETPVIQGVRGYRIFIHKDDEVLLNPESLIKVLEILIKYLNKNYQIKVS